MRSAIGVRSPCRCTTMTYRVARKFSELKRLKKSYGFTCFTKYPIGTSFPMFFLTVQTESENLTSSSTACDFSASIKTAKHKSATSRETILDGCRRPAAPARPANLGDRGRQQQLDDHDSESNAAAVDRVRPGPAAATSHRD